MSSQDEQAASPAVTVDQCQDADAEASRWPQPIPEEWKQRRAAKADEWFERQKEELHMQYHSAKQAVVDAVAMAEAEAAEAAAFDARVAAMVREQQAFSRSVQQQLSVLRQQRLQANLDYEALRLPHFTPPRPLALTTAPEGGTSFAERLFNRALATTLMAAVAAAPQTAAAAGGGGGGGEAVWCEMGQSRASLQDPPLARAEALERCRVAVVVLSRALMASPNWVLERRILTARLAAPPGTWPGAPLAAVFFVRLHVPPPTSVGVAAAAAVAGLGRKAAAAVAASTAAAALPDPNPLPPLVLPEPVPGYAVQSYPVTVMDLTVPLPANPPLDGAAAGTALAQSVRAAVGDVLRVASAHGCLAAAGLRLLPDPPPIHIHPSHVHQQPEQLLAAVVLAATAGSGGGGGGGALTGQLRSSLTLGSALAGTGSSNCLATQILASPANAAVAAGPAATAAHLLPLPYTQRAVDDWTMYDTAVWLSSHGRSIAHWADGFLRLAVDGPLLRAADEYDIRAACGVASDRAVRTIMDSLASAKRRPSVLPPSRALLPASGCPAAPLAPEAAVLPVPQRLALLADVFAYYDQDHSGDLNLTELDRLLRACGLRLNTVRLKDVLDDYDDDSDGRLSDLETQRLLEDVWRLVMAQQDVAAWTPSEAASALRAVDLAWPLETPRATPDADKTASTLGARAAARRGGGGGGSPAGSETASINIIGSGGGGSPASTPPRSARFDLSAAASGGGGATTTRTSSFSAAATSPGRNASSSRRALPLVEGEDETGARVRLLDCTYSMAAIRGSDGGMSSSSGGGDDDGGGSIVSYATYSWGLPPRLAMQASSAAAAAAAGARRQSEASWESSMAPWAGAVTPRSVRAGGRQALFPEEMAARDVDVQRLLRRERAKPEIQESLRLMLDCLDLRRGGQVELQMLRASLASVGPANQLSPLHTQILSDLAEEQAQLPTATTATGAVAAATLTASSTGRASRRLLASGPLGEALLGLEVPVKSYISSAVQAVSSAQEALLEVVYGERGLSPMLRQLYRQTTGPDDPLELLTRGPRIQPAAAAAALETLLEVQGIQPTALIRAALLPAHLLPQDDNLQDEAEDGRGGGGGADGIVRQSSAAVIGTCAGGPTPLSLHSARRYPQSWASTTAHVVHVYQVLLRRCTAGGGSGGDNR